VFVNAFLQIFLASISFKENASAGVNLNEVLSKKLILFERLSFDFHLNEFLKFTAT